MSKVNISEQYVEHRKLATHLESIYFEIEKLAKKKPSDRLSPLIVKKINHLIVIVRVQVIGDVFLDAIETLPVEGEQVRFDEALVILAELRSIMDRQWNSDEYKKYRSNNKLQYDHQTMR